MLSERDLKIIRYIEKFGFITISQCYKMFFKDRSYGYDLARKRLAKLQQKGHLSSLIDYLERNPEKIYYIDEQYSSPSKHTILIMNALAEVYQLDAEVIYFSREQEWLGGERRSDGYIIFKIESYLYQLFVEVEGQLTGKKRKREEVLEDFNQKYSDILASNEPIQIACDCFGIPISQNTRFTLITRILVVDGFDHKIPYYVDNQRVIQVDYTYKKFGQILI